MEKTSISDMIMGAGVVAIICGTAIVAFSQFHNGTDEKCVQKFEEQRDRCLADSTTHDSAIECMKNYKEGKEICKTK